MASCQTYVSPDIVLQEFPICMSRNEDSQEDAASQIHLRRSTRKRTHEETQSNEGDKPDGTTDSLQPSLGDTSEPTPPDSPVPNKIRKVSFSGRIEWYNPILKERTYREISDDVKEVQLLTVPPVKCKKAQKKTPNTKKRKMMLATLKKAQGEDKAAWEQEVHSDKSAATNEISIPATSVSPANLRPVLKLPGGFNWREKTHSEEVSVANLLCEQYGDDFEYYKCAKVDGRYHCPDSECSDNNYRGYRFVKGLREHIRAYHLEATLVNCPNCLKVFSTRSKLKQHVITHSGSRPYKCQSCGIKFRRSHSLNQHEAGHNKPMSCHHCEKVFNTRMSIIHHFRDTPIECCSRSFYCRTKFKQHEKEMNHSYKCTSCENTFSARSTFKKHVLDAHSDSNAAIIPLPSPSQDIHHSSQQQHSPSSTSKSQHLHITSP